MKKSLIVISILASCSFAGIIKSVQSPTLYDSGNCCGGYCASGSAISFTCDSDQVAYSGLFMSRPGTQTCQAASYIASGYEPFFRPNACSKAGNNQCTTTSGASGTLIKDGNTGQIGCFSVPRYSNYNPDNLSTTCSDGYSSIGGKCMPMTCPQGMICSTNANGTLKMTGSQEKIYSRKHANGDIDAIMPDGAYITYDKNGNPVRYVDKNGNIVQDSLSAGTSSPFLTDPRGSAFNPIIAGGLFVGGALITSAGVLAMPITAGAGAGVVTAGAYMMSAGLGMGLYSVFKDASGAPVPPPSSSSSSSETTITLDINSIDTSSASGSSGGSSAPVSSTKNSNGSVTNVYKPNASTVITETKNSDGVNDYIVKDTSSNTVSSFSVNSSDLEDKGASSLQPQAVPVTYHAVTDNNNVSGAEGSYVPDPATGGYIPSNPQQSQQSSSGSTASGSTSGAAGTSSSGSSSGGSIQNGKTSGAAGTDGNSTTGAGKDFGDGFDDLGSFASLKDTLQSLSNFKDTISKSFDNLQNSISSLKHTFQGDDGKSKINASLGAGDSGSCQMSFTVFGATVNFSGGLSSIAPKVRPFVSFLVFILMTVWSIRRVYIVIRGGSN